LADDIIDAFLERVTAHEKIVVKAECPVNDRHASVQPDKVMVEVGVQESHFTHHAVAPGFIVKWNFIDVFLEQINLTYAAIEFGPAVRVEVTPVPRTDIGWSQVRQDHL